MNRPTCPKCGSHDVIIRVDAYANYQLTGFDENGHPTSIWGEPQSVTTFDDRLYECRGCGESSERPEFFDGKEGN